MYNSDDHYYISLYKTVCMLDLIIMKSMVASANHLSDTSHDEGTQPCLLDIVRLDNLDGYA